MPRNIRQKGNKNEKKLGWKNADNEFDQISFADSSVIANRRSITDDSPISIEQHDDYENVGEAILNDGKALATVSADCIENIPLSSFASKDRRCYPSSTLSINPSHYLCTMLPSKQNYISNPELGHTVSRRRTMARTAERNEPIQRRIASLPSENRIQYVLPEDEVHTNLNIEQEAEHWEQLMAIKSMPASMSVKRKYKLKLQNAPVKHASGSASWRLSARKSNRKFKESLKEFKSKFNLWHSSLKAIEGHFGTGVVSYFVFIRWLLFLNCFIFSLIFIFIILPTLIFTKVPLYAVDVNAVPAGNNVTATSPLNANDTGSRIPDWYSTYVNATSKYRRNVRNMTQVSAKARIQDLLQGTGWMELTVMFYGAFEPNNLFIGRFSGQDHWYFLPASYMVVTVVYFFFSMIFMVKSMVKGSRETLVINEGQFYRYFNIVFGSWDFCITDNNAAELKQMGIYMEIQTNLKEDEFNALKNERSNLMKFGLYTVRLIVNLISLAILVGAGYLIYYVTIQSVEIREKNEGKLSKIVELLLEFLTPLTITLLYLALPSLFRALVALEKYRLQFALNITLFRTVFVRLASLAVLMSTFSQQITCDKDDPDCVKLACWETYVGQQLYKLVIVDFMVVVLATFFMELPRRLIVTKFSYKIFSLIGKPEFNVTMNVLDLVYSQTLCWLGCFYCPLLPAISIIKFLSYFYIKKFTLLHNCKPSTLAYKASRSNTFFMVVLFLAFLFCCIPLIYSVSEITPSRGCGPFRLNDDIWQVVSSSVHQWPNILSQIMSIVCTPVFATPVFIILCLTMYYYYMITLAHKQMVSVLKEQLKEEGIDKQYLLARLTQQTRLTT